MQPCPHNPQRALHSYLTYSTTSCRSEAKMPMSGVRCPSCAARGRQTWVTPGHDCPATFCGETCDGSHTSSGMMTTLPRAPAWKYYGDLIFARNQECGSNRSEVDASLFAETWTAAQSKRFTSEDFINKTEFIHTPMSTKLL